MKDCHEGNLINVPFCVFSASFHEEVAFGNEKEGIGQIWGSFCHFYFPFTVRYGTISMASNYYHLEHSPFFLVSSTSCFQLFSTFFGENLELIPA